jgi:hypothetical protein
MEHEVSNVGLRPLVHHVVVFVNMENMRWYDVVCPPFRPPSRERVIVVFHNHGHWTASPFKQLRETPSGVGYLVEVVEVDIKNRVNHHLFAAERCALTASPWFPKNPMIIFENRNLQGVWCKRFVIISLILNRINNHRA